MLWTADIWLRYRCTSYKCIIRAIISFNDLFLKLLLNVLVNRKLTDNFTEVNTKYFMEVHMKDF